MERNKIEREDQEDSFFFFLVKVIVVDLLFEFIFVSAVYFRF